MAIEPKNIEIRNSDIAIEWSDSHIGVFSGRTLRLNCHCASCVEEWTGRKLLDPVNVPSDIEALDYIRIGRYAIQILWSDGHETGIYPFEMLRELCPCGEC